MGGGLPLGRRQAGGPGSPAPAPAGARLPHLFPRRSRIFCTYSHSSRPTGSSSGRGRGAPYTTLHTAFSAKLRAAGGPSGAAAGMLGALGLLPGRLQGPLPAPHPGPRAASSHGPPRSLAGSPRPPRACGGSEDQGQLRAGISTVSRAGGREPRGSLSTRSPQGLAHSWGGAQHQRPPPPDSYCPPALWPVRGQNPATQHKGAWSTWLVCGSTEDPVRVAPTPAPRAGMGRVFTWPRFVLLDPCHVRPRAQPGLRQGQRGHRVQVTLLVPRASGTLLGDQHLTVE